MFLFLVGIYIVLFFLLAYLFARRDGYLSLFVVFGLTGFYYNLTCPLELYFRGWTVFSEGGYSYRFSPTQQVVIGIASILAMCAFAAGHYLPRSGMNAFVSSVADREVRIPWSVTFVGVAAFLTLAIVYGRSLLEYRSYTEQYQYAYTSSFQSQLLEYLLFSMAVAAAILFLGTLLQRVSAVAIAGLVSTWGIYTSDKNPLVLAFAAIVVIFVGPRSKKWPYLAAMVAALAFAMFGSVLFTRYRAHVSLKVVESARDFSTLQTDARGPMCLLLEATDRQTGFLFGQTYFPAMTGWIPRAFYPDRPLDASEQFARVKLQKWKPGQGLGYSLLGESYFNFGFIGVIVVYFILGFLFDGFLRWTTVRVGDAFPHCVIALYSCAGFYWVTIMHRGPISQLTRAFIYWCLIPYLLFLVLDGPFLRSMLHRDSTYFERAGLQRRSRWWKSKEE